MPLSVNVEALRHDYANLLLGGGSLAALLVGVRLQTLNGWRVTLCMMGVISLWAWYANLRRYRTLADTPTARIATAPQGYVEIVGRGRQIPGDALRSRFTGLPCLWYRYRIERRSGNSWETVESGVSDDTFGIDDGTGLMLVDPEGAEIVTSRKRVSLEADYRQTEWTLLAGDALSVIGEHITLGGPNAVLDKPGDIAALLADWKRDRAALVARFDADRDGEIDLAEWENARHSAVAEVEQMHRAARLAQGVHVLRKPAYQRPFLIANRGAEALTRHYRIWSVAHLAILSGALCALVFLAGHG